jgi:hypothetical protein
MTRVHQAAVDLELTRVPGDRRSYALAGIGTLRLTGLLGRSATAEAGGSRWRLARRGFWRREIEAVRDTGEVDGEFVPRAIRRGGSLRWGDRELTLTPASSWRERYALVDAERELVLLDGKGWGRRPVRITMQEPGAVEAGLLLFAAFVVRGLAEDAGSGAAAGSSAAVGSYS